MTEEVWTPISGWEGYYEVSNLGRVRRPAHSKGRYKTEKVLRPKKTKHGVPYLQVILKNQAVGTKTMYVHSLVCSAFHGARPDGFQACHNDGNSLNNRADNLRWDTRSANERDRHRHGTHNRGERHGLAKLKDIQVLEIRNLLAGGCSKRSLALQFGVSQSCIWLIATGRRWVPGNPENIGVAA